MVELGSLKTLYEKLDIVSNLVEQMKLMHSVKDSMNFDIAYEKASKLCFDSLRQIEDMSLEDIGLEDERHGAR